MVAEKENCLVQLVVLLPVWFRRNAVSGSLDGGFTAALENAMANICMPLLQRNCTTTVPAR
jgi:hypothetical protein